MPPRPEDPYPTEQAYVWSRIVNEVERRQRVLARAAKLGSMAPKRGYSRAFTPKTERRVQLMIDRVPPTLLNAARAKAKRDGVSLRALILGWLKEWVK